MCGLAGTASSEARKDEYFRKMAFRQLLQMQEFRGKDATGVACVGLKDTKAQPFVYKKAMRASDFVQMQTYDRQVEFRFDEFAYILGHARSATSGKVDADRDYNAHPFTHGPVTLTHNGHIRNYNSLKSGTVDIQVDSAHVAGALALADPAEAKDVLEKLEGGFALAWHDARDGSLNFARNNERPLFWVYIEGQNTMYWASELETMHAALKRNNMKLDGKYRHCTSFNHFKFDIKNLREFTRVPFVHRPSSTPTSSASGSAWKEGTGRLPGTQNGNQTKTSGSTAGGAKFSVTHMATLRERVETPVIRMITTELDKELDTGTESTSVFGPKERPCRPTSKKKLRKVKMSLQELGVSLDSVRCFTPVSFREYKNHDPARGEICGTDRIREGLHYSCPNSPKALWDTVRGKKIYGRVSNYKEENGLKIVVLDYAPDLQERFIDRYRSIQTNLDNALLRRSAERDQHIRAHQEESQEALEDLTVEGPKGARISKEEFEKRVEHGCSNCTADILVSDAKDIVWAGLMGEFPLCKQCVLQDPAIQETFGANKRGF